MIGNATTTPQQEPTSRANSLTASRDNPFNIDFAQHDITGVVRTMRQPGGDDDDWVIVSLDGNRTATGEVGEEDEPLQVGVAYRWFGTWTHRIKHGNQFKFDSYIVSPRQEHLGVVAFLSRSDFGLTKLDAQRLWKYAGSEAINRLRDTPGVLVDAGVLSDEKAVRASAALRSGVNDEETKISLFELFGNHGFPRGTVKACIKQWGRRAPTVVRRDPFRMLVADLPGVGFKRADKLYLALGGNPLRLKRQTLAAWHWLASNSSGNTWEIEGGLHRAILDATGSFDNSDFTRAIELGVRARWLAVRENRDWRGWMWGGEQPVERFYAERGAAADEAKLAKHIRRVLTHQPVWPEITPADLADKHQRTRVQPILSSPLAILAGIPGTGKTFVAAALIRKLLEKIPAGRIIVACPTGKASVRITEAMRRYQLPLTARTIHHTLEIDGNTHDRFVFQRNESKPLDASVVIIDEASMIDTALAASLFAAVPPGANVLLVGDPYQLSPVSRGAPLRDVIDAGIPMAMLTEIKRNEGAIVLACRDIKDGKRFTCSPRIDEAAGANLVHLDASDEEAQLATLINLVSALHTRGFNPIWDAQVLCMTNDKGKVSRKQLNGTLQTVLNPVNENAGPAAINPIYRPGDKVICLKNTQVELWGLSVDRGLVASDISTDYQKLSGANAATAYVANGDMGRVLAVDRTSAIVQFVLPDRVTKIHTARAKKKDDSAAGVAGSGAGSESASKVDFDLAYAVTTHKSQGSEWPVVIVMIDENAGPLGCRELVYTAISRAARLCFLIGKLPTAFRWVQKVNLQKRKTFLKELLTENG